ncbi:MAG: VWA domain-containing protein [Capsulimonadaceae bacterium]|nr:VWA domain-containing protein [Capsulimonadaceae bacterium]
MAEQESIGTLDDVVANGRNDSVATTALASPAAPTSQDGELLDFTPKPSIAFRCATEYSTLYASRELRQHILFELRAASSMRDEGRSPQSGGARSRSPVNLCLCLDRSGSMEGDPLTYAKKACIDVVNRLGPDDVLSVVTFAEQSDVLLPATRGAEKGPITRQLERIAIGNRTNLYKGLEAAIEQVFAGRTPTSLNRILLLSDGEPTAGLKDFQSIVTLVTDRKRDAIKVSGLGFGPAYNEELIAALARRSGGNYYYIARPELLPEVFAAELDGLMRTAARNVRLRVRFPDGVVPRQVYANEMQAQGKRAYEVNLVDVEHGGAVTSLWELDIAAHAQGAFRMAAAEIEYDDCATGRRERELRDIVVTFAADSRQTARMADPRVLAEVRLMHAARQLDQTMLAMRSHSGSVGDALGDLERTQKLLIASGSSTQAVLVRRAIEDIRAGESIEKTLIGAIVPIDQGRRT